MRCTMQHADMPVSTWGGLNLIFLIFKNSGQFADWCSASVIASLRGARECNEQWTMDGFWYLYHQTSADQRSITQPYGN